VRGKCGSAHLDLELVGVDDAVELVEGEVSNRRHPDPPLATELHNDNNAGSEFRNL
jgi:hypothetical protein